MATIPVGIKDKSTHDSSLPMPHTSQLPGTARAGREVNGLTTEES